LFLGTNGSGSLACDLTILKRAPGTGKPRRISPRLLESMLLAQSSLSCGKDAVGSSLKKRVLVRLKSCTQTIIISFLSNALANAGARFSVDCVGWCSARCAAHESFQRNWVEPKKRTKQN
jgi:hypothetical protein